MPYFFSYENNTSVPQNICQHTDDKTQSKLDQKLDFDQGLHYYSQVLYAPLRQISLQKQL